MKNKQVKSKQVKNKQRLLKILLAIIFFANKSLSACCLTPIADSPVSAQVNPAIVAYSPNGQCVVVSNNGSGSLSVFSVNGTNCALTPVQTISSNGNNPLGIAFSPNGDCFAVVNNGSNNVTIFSTNPDCTLTQTDTEATGTSPFSVAFSANGQCLVVSNKTAGTLSRYSVDASTCTLTPLGVPIATAASPSGIGFSPNGNCLFVAHDTSPGSISTYSFDQSDCSLTFLSNISSQGDAPEFFSISNNGQCFAIANQGSSSLAFFSLNQANCQLTFVGTSGATIPEAALPTFPAFSPDGSCLSVTLGGLDAIYTFNVNPDCSLTFNDDFLTFGTLPLGLAYSPDGRCLTVANFNSSPVGGNIVTYTVFTVEVEPSELTICEGGTIELTANAFGGVGTYSYSWTGPNGFVSNNQTINIPNATVLNAGDYVVIVTDSGEPACEGTAQATVTVNANPTVIIEPATVTICQGQTINLAANPSGGTGPYTFSWTGPNGFVSANQNISIPNAQPINSGLYTVTVTDANGCQGTDSAQVTVNTNPTVTIDPATLSVCQGQTINFAANPSGGTGPYTFSWTGPNGFVSVNQNISIPNAQPVNSGLYTVTVTDANGCQGTDSAQVTVNTNPTVTIDPATLSVCQGQTINLAANPSGGTGPYTFSWTGPNGFVSVNQNISIPNAQPVNSGLYAVTVTDANGCQGTDSAQVTVNTNPTVTIEPATLNICQGQTINLAANPSEGTGPYTFSWTGPNGFVSVNQNISIANAQPVNSGLYTVTVTDANGCQGTNSVQVTVNPGPNVTINPASLNICEGQTVNLSANPIGGTFPYTFAWTGPNGFVSINQNISIPNSQPVNSGLYTVVVTDADDCQGTNSAQVTVNTNPVVTINPATLTICQAQTINLAANPSEGTAPYTFAWTGPNGYVSTNQNISIPNAQPINSGLYTVVVTDANSCQGENSAQVVVNENPIVSITPNVLFITLGQTIEFTAQVTQQPNVTYSYSWTGPNGFTSNDQTIIIPNASANNAGTYSVTVTDSRECQSTAQAQVFIGEIQAVDEKYITCTNQTLHIIDRIHSNARFVFTPALSSNALQNAARSIFDPLLASTQVEVIAEPSFGKLILYPNGSFIYIPRRNFSGQDSFIIRVGTSSAFSNSSVATITIDVNPCCSYNTLIR